MDYKSHKAVSAGAVRLQPQPSAQYWSEHLPLLEEASVFPDIFWPGENSSPEFLAKYPQWRDYTMIPTSQGLISCHQAFDPIRLWESYPEVLTFLVDNALSELAAGDHTRAVTFTGIISHIVGDTGQAAHCVDPRVLSTFFQAPGEVYLMHTYMENSPVAVYPPHDYAPLSLGDSAEELKWRLLHRLAQLKRSSLLTVVPIMTSLLAGDVDTASKYASKTVGECSDVLADALLSLYQINQGIKNAPRQISLTDLEYFGGYCDSMFNFLPQLNAIPGKGKDDSIPLDLGNGPEKGVALLPTLFPRFAQRRQTYADYTLPPGIFRELTFSCGLNRNAPRNETSCYFEIYLDGKLAWQSPPTGADAPNMNVAVPLGNASTLRLLAADAREDASDTKFVYPCFTSPLLHK